MDTAQADALMGALAANVVPADAQMRFSAGAQTWSVSVPPTTILTGAQVATLQGYCAAHGLTLSLQFSSLVVV